MSARLLVVLACAAVLLPRGAAAQWSIAGYAGAAHTPSRSLDITRRGGETFSIPDVEFRGAATKSPIYYGYRIGWQGDRLPFGIEAEFTHAKVIAVDTLSTSLTAFEMSHGLNFVLANAVFRSDHRCGGRCTFVARGGGGFTLPHVEGTLDGERTYAYQFAGPAVQGGVGVEIPIRGGLMAVADGRLTYAKVTADLSNAQLKDGFTTWHVDVGLGWRFR